MMNDVTASMTTLTAARAHPTVVVIKPAPALEFDVEHDRESVTAHTSATPRNDSEDESDSEGSVHSFGSVSSSSVAPPRLLSPPPPPPPPAAAAAAVERATETDLLVVMDWDDCLFPTSELRRWHQTLQQDDLRLKDLREPAVTPHPLGVEAKRQLDATEEVALQVLATARALGLVVVVTNSEDGWVRQSCQAVFPRLWQALQHVTVYSARSQHQTAWQALAMSLGTPASAEWLVCWKRQAFLQLIQSLAPAAVLGVGDRAHDREALLSLRPHCLRVTLSHVQTLATPTLPCFQAQWRTLLPCLQTFDPACGLLDWMLEEAPNPCHLPQHLDTKNEKH